MRFRRLIWMLAPALFAGALSCTAIAATAKQTPGAHTKAAAKTTALPIELVESVPVETNLGNPELRQARDVWPEMIRTAKHRIDFEQFYATSWPGEPLESVMAAIDSAAHRGVKIRFLCDHGMNATDPALIARLAALPGCEVRRIDMSRMAGGVQHAKFFIVDDVATFVGSQNFDWRSLSHIHELGVRVNDARLADIFGDVFRYDWQAADTTTWVERSVQFPNGRTETRRFPKPIAARTLDVPLRIVEAPGDTVRLWPGYSPKGWIPDSTRWDMADAVRLIERAQREVVVQLLTYAPAEFGQTDSTLDQAMRAAAARGVQVKLLISDWEQSSRGMAWLQRLARVPNIEARLSTVQAWSGGYIPYARVEHCKYAVSDRDAVWIGTSNWGAGYFYGTRGLALTLENARLASQARTIFEASWTAPGAVAVNPDTTYPQKIHGDKASEGMKLYGK